MIIVSACFCKLYAESSSYLWNMFAVIRYLWVVKEYEDKGFSVATLSGQGLHGFNKYIPFT